MTLNDINVHKLCLYLVEKRSINCIEIRGLVITNTMKAHGCFRLKDEKTSFLFDRFIILRIRINLSYTAVDKKI